jgi:outer membrane biosynthesis protein TonB
LNALLLQFGRPVALCLSFLVTAQMTAGALPLEQVQNQQPAQQTQPATPDSQPAQQPAQQPEQQPPANQQAQPATPAQQPEAPAPGFASRSQDAAQPGDVEQKDAQNPVGTAAAPLSRPSGVAGSRPAGAAIAPAKQKRVKAIFIRVGLIVAGAAAAGAVIGLSKGSPSHPQ